MQKLAYRLIITGISIIKINANYIINYPYGCCSRFFIFIILLSSTAMAQQIKKLDEAYGHKSYGFGTPRSEFADILEESTDGSSSYRATLSKTPELQYAFGDSVRFIYFRFNDADKLSEIKFIIPV